MQKKLIALAVAGLVSGAAFAQSNVTVYGVADATFDNVKVTGTGANEPRHSRVSTNSSYLGFKGVEDLGNGLKAVFQFEGSVGFDAGGAWGGSNRDSMVALAGGFGTVAMGNLTGPTRSLGASLDVFAGATGIGANSGIIGKFGGALQGVTVDANSNPTAAACGRSSTCTGPFDTRFKNAIAYISPDFAGLTVIGAYVANENKTESTINTYGYDLGAIYKAGPIMGGLTYNVVKGNNTAAFAGLVDVKLADTRLGGSYDLGVVKINALFDRVKVTAAGLSETQKTWGIGVSAPVGPGKIVGQYYQAKDISNTNDTGAKLYAIGYEYGLSKRTIAKVTYASLKNEQNAGYQMAINATTLGEKMQGFQAGIRHSF